jgi:uncharacterized SAM-binding protein YcdF (DUF218 family)
MLMLLRFKFLLKTVILPPTGPLLLAVLGVFLLRRRPRLARACLVLGLGALWLLSTPVVCDALSAWAEHYPPLDLKSAAGAQAIVILGGGGERALAPEYGGPAAEPLLLERLSYGAYVARKTGLPILVTGFRTEAAAMQDTLMRNFDIEPRWVDGASFDTFENAGNSARLLGAGGIRRIILVTHSTHMWRAAHEFTDAGLQVIPAPMGMLAPREFGFLDYVPDVDALQRGVAALYELLGEPVRVFFAATHLRRHAGMEIHEPPRSTGGASPSQGWATLPAGAAYQPGSR